MKRFLNEKPLLDKTQASADSEAVHLQQGEGDVEPGGVDAEAVAAYVQHFAGLGPSANVTKETLIPNVAALAASFEARQRSIFKIAAEVRDEGLLLPYAIAQDIAQLEAALGALPGSSEGSSALRSTLETYFRTLKQGLYAPQVFALVTGFEAGEQRVFKSADLNESIYAGYQTTFVQALQIALSLRTVEQARERLPQLPRPGQAVPTARPAPRAAPQVSAGPPRKPSDAASPGSPASGWGGATAVQADEECSDPRVQFGTHAAHRRNGPDWRVLLRKRRLPSVHGATGAGVLRGHAPEHREGPPRGARS